MLHRTYKNGYVSTGTYQNSQIVTPCIIRTLQVCCWRHRGKAPHLPTIASPSGTTQTHSGVTRRGTQQSFFVARIIYYLLRSTVLSVPTEGGGQQNTGWRIAELTRAHKTRLRFSPNVFLTVNAHVNGHKHLTVWLPLAKPLPRSRSYCWVISSNYLCNARW